MSPTSSHRSTRLPLFHPCNSLKSPSFSPSLFQPPLVSSPAPSLGMLSVASLRLTKVIDQRPPTHSAIANEDLFSPKTTTTRSRRALHQPFTSASSKSPHPRRQPRMTSVLHPSRSWARRRRYRRLRLKDASCLTPSIPLPYQKAMVITTVRVPEVFLTRARRRVLLNFVGLRALHVTMIGRYESSAFFLR